MIDRYKKSWKYIRPQLKYLISMVLFLILFQVTLMLSPLITQKLIDNNLLILDDTWYEVNINSNNINDKYLKDNDIAKFNNHYYKSIKHLLDSDNIEHEVSIVLVESNYYFINSKVDSKQGTINNNIYTTKTNEYEAQQLSKNDIKAFYNPIIDNSIILICLLLFVLVINLIFSYLQRISGAFLTINTTKNIRLTAAKKLEYIDISIIENDPAGKLANRFLNDSMGVSDLYISTINVFLSSILSIILSFIGMFILSPKMATFCLLILPIMFFWIKWFVKKIKIIAEKINETNSLLIAQVNEIINGISILKIFNSKQQTLDKFENLNNKYLDESMDEVRLHLKYGWNGVNLFQGLIIGIVIVLFGLLDIYQISPVEAGVIYAYYNYLNKIISPINILFHEFSRMEHATVKFGRISRILDAPSEEKTIHKIPAYKGLIQFNNVNFYYNDHTQILKNINFTANPGEKIGIVGRTGAGKSTLINLLMRFNEIKDNTNSSGQITIDNTSIYKNNKRTYRQYIGIILQEPIIFHGSLYSNIKMNNDCSKQEATNILKLIGGEKLLKKFDNDILKEIKNRGSNLSLGEKQLISFARILVQNPQIIIMDEATANIDTETEEIINKGLETISKNKTTLIIAHRLATIKNSDQILVLDRGEIIEKGSHNQLLEKRGKYHEMWMNQT